MMMVARRSGDDGRVTVANSYKQLRQPGAPGNGCNYTSLMSSVTSAQP